MMGLFGAEPTKSALVLLTDVKTLQRSKER